MSVGYHSLRVPSVQLKDEALELEELREMKADIERREKTQATVIENQAKRLDELEVLYKVKKSSRLAIYRHFERQAELKYFFRRKFS